MSGRRFGIISVFIAAAMLFVAAFSFAAGAVPGAAGDNRTIEIFDGEAEIFLSEGWELDYLNEDMVMLYPLFEYEYIAAEITRHTNGYIEGADDITIDMSKFLEKYEQYYDDVWLNREPHHEPHIPRLSWTVAFSTGDHSYFMYEEYIFTRTGYLELRVIYSEYDLNSGMTEQIKDVVFITAGNRYGDFDQGTDSYCGYDVISPILYWDYWDQGSDDFVFSGMLSEGFDFSVLTNILFVVIMLLVIFRSKKLSKAKPRSKAQRLKPPKDKAPFRIRRAHDNDAAAYKPGDGPNYYQKLRREEERDAYRYADRSD